MQTMVVEKKVTLLLVDDEDDLRVILTERLETEGFNVLCARNGVEALRIIKKSVAEKDDGIDAILSDIRMPEMDGLELLKELREMGCQIPFVIVSGFRDKTNTSQAFNLGAIEFVEKPFNFRELITIVHHALIHDSNEKSSGGSAKSSKKKSASGRKSA